MLSRVAWAAGVFEGEGCFLIHSNHSGKYLIGSAVLNTTDLDVLEDFLSVVEVGKITGPIDRGKNAKEHWKPIYRWQTAALDSVLKVVNLFLPYLGDRRLIQAANMVSRDTRIRGD